MADERREKALVVVPTFNERDSISEVVQRLFDATRGSVDLLVVDDASPDGTAGVVRNLAAARNGVHLIERSGKQGLGTAYLTGFNWAIERGLYWAVVEMDADLSHDPADVPRLLAALENADLVIGSRYVPGGSIRNWGLFRRVLSRAGNVYARFWLGFDIHDSTSGFRAYQTSWLVRQDLSSVASEGYVFQIDMARRVADDRGTIVEVPIAFVQRTAGESKISRRIVFEAMVNVVRWGVRRRLARGRASQSA